MAAYNRGGTSNARGGYRGSFDFSSFNQRAGSSRGVSGFDAINRGSSSNARGGSRGSNRGASNFESNNHGSGSNRGASDSGGSNRGGLFNNASNPRGGRYNRGGSHQQPNGDANHENVAQPFNQEDRAGNSGCQYMDRSQVGGKAFKVDSIPDEMFTAVNGDLFGRLEGKKFNELKDAKASLAAVDMPRKKAYKNWWPQKRDVEVILREDDISERHYSQIFDFPGITVVDQQQPAFLESWDEDAVLKFEKDENNFLRTNIRRAHYAKPRLVQQYCIPPIMSGFNLKLHAPNGSGKTVGYLVPVVKLCDTACTKNADPKVGAPFVVIISPTRDLAEQIYEQTLKFTQGTHLIVARSYGQMDMNVSQPQVLGCHILVTTPGRLLDDNLNELSMQKLRFLIFDEGHVLLGREFEAQIQSVMDKFDSTLKENHDYKVLLISATSSTDSDLNFEKYAKNGQTVTVKENFAVSKNVEQRFQELAYNHRFAEVLRIIVTKELGKKYFIFVNTLEESELFGSCLAQFGVNAKPFSSLRNQADRDKTMKEFRGDAVVALICTDVCARGIDIKEVDCVINWSLPKRFEIYAQRVGRTGRIKAGTSISFVELPKDSRVVKEIYESEMNRVDKAGQTLHPTLMELNKKIGEEKKPFRNTAFSVFPATSANNAQMAPVYFANPNMEPLGTKRIGIQQPAEVQQQPAEVQQPDEVQQQDEVTAPSNAPQVEVQQQPAEVTAPSNAPQVEVQHPAEVQQPDEVQQQDEVTAPSNAPQVEVQQQPAEVTAPSNAPQVEVQQQPAEVAAPSNAQNNRQVHPELEKIIQTCASPVKQKQHEVQADVAKQMNQVPSAALPVFGARGFDPNDPIHIKLLQECIEMKAEADKKAMSGAPVESGSKQSQKTVSFQENPLFANEKKEADPLVKADADATEEAPLAETDEGAELEKSRNASSSSDGWGDGSGRPQHKESGAGGDTDFDFGSRDW